MRTEQIDQRQIGHQASVRHASAFENRDGFLARRHRARRLVHQPRLPHAGLADHADRMALAGGHLREQAVEQRDFALAADEQPEVASRLKQRLRRAAGARSREMRPTARPAPQVRLHVPRHRPLVVSLIRIAPGSANCCSSAAVRSASPTATYSTWSRSVTRLITSGPVVTPVFSVIRSSSIDDDGASVRTRRSISSATRIARRASSSWTSRAPNTATNPSACVCVMTPS